jgi:hypothetical protein
MGSVISLAQVNRFTMARHGLRERLALDPVGLVGQLCGLQAQVAPGPYLALWARLRDFSIAGVERALYEERSLTRLWLMRGTLHVVPTADLPIYIGATVGLGLQRWASYLPSGVGAEDIPWARLRELSREALSGGPLSKNELIESLEASGTALPAGLSWGQFLYGLCMQGLLVHARPSGGWHHYGRVRFAWRADWTGIPDEEILPEEEAWARLLLRYLGAFGPATVQDFAHWVGLKVGQARAALKQVQPQLSEVRLEDDERRFWVLQEDLPALLAADSRSLLPPRLLPRFDPLLLGYRDKARVLPVEHYKQIFRPQAEVSAAVLVEGGVVGTWKYRLPGGRLKDVSLEPFSPLPAEVQEALAEEVAVLERWVNEGGA